MIKSCLFIYNHQALREEDNQYAELKTGLRGDIRELRRTVSLYESLHLAELCILLLHRLYTPTKELRWFKE